MNRRDFIKGTAAGAAALTAGASLLPTKARAAGTVPSRWVFVNMGGGWDSCYSIDPKPGMATVSQPPGTMLEYNGGAMHVWDWKPKVLATDPDSNVKKFFDQWNSVACIVKGVNTRTISHMIAAQRIYCGKQGGTSPDMPTIIGFEKFKDMPVPYLLINGPGWAGPLGAAVGRVGQTGQLRVLIDPTQSQVPLSFMPSAQDEADIEAFHNANAERERAIRGSVGYNKARIDDFENSLIHADMLRDKGKNMNFGAGGIQGGADTAISAFKLGLAGVCMIDSGFGFDTHSNNKSQGPSQDGVYAGLNYLANQLLATPDPLFPGDNMMAHTTVVLLSEFTRTPKLNGGQGKDHWPVNTNLIFGCGVNGGRQVGETGEGMVAMPLNLDTGATSGPNLASMGTEIYCSGVIELAGVDHTKYFGSGTPALKAIAL